MDKIKYFKNFPQKIFFILYSISVGVERIQKVLFLLVEEFKEEDFKKLEKKFKNHHHTKLHELINKNNDFILCQVQKNFLNLLDEFYRSCRYGRFKLGNNYALERNLLIDFIEKYTKKSIKTDGFFATNNDEEIKLFFGKVIKEMVEKYYELISQKATEINIYTYETRTESNSRKVFLCPKEMNSYHEIIRNEERAFKEFLVFLLNTKSTPSVLKHIHSIMPLELDIYDAKDIIYNLSKGICPQLLTDYVSTLLEEEEDNTERNELIACIGNPDFLFDEIEEDYLDDSDFDDNI
jgi:hypothetical protein